jgi:hypothetical protein
LATAITLLEGYPWISLQKDESLNPANPYRTMFVAVNEGYVPLSSIEVSCISTFKTTTGAFDHNVATYPIGATIWHEGRFTIPCTHVLKSTNDPDSGPWITAGVDEVTEADMDVAISYSILGISMKPFRRSRSFHVKAEKSADSSWHWSFTG